MKNEVEKLDEIRYTRFKYDNYIDRLRQLCLIYTYLEDVIGDKTHEIKQIQLIIEKLQRENCEIK